MKNLLYLILVAWAFFANAQATFNKRMRFGFPAAVLTSLIPTDSCFYATSIIADSVYPYRTGSAFLKFGLDGGLLDIKTIRSTVKTYETWNDNFLQLSDGSFAVQGYSIDTTMNAILIKYDKSGDTVFTRSYPNPYYPVFEFIQPRGGLVACEDGGFLIANTFQSSASSNENYLIKTDSLGNVEWDRVYVNSDWDRPQSLLATPDGKYIVGAIQTNENVANKDYIFRCHIFQVDSLGNKEWDYLSPLSDGLRDAANDMVLLEDGSLVVASGVGHEQERTSVNVVYFDKMVFKLSPDRQLEWERKFQDEEITNISKATKIIDLLDGSGFIIGGMAYEVLQQNIFGTGRGWVIKLNNEGETIWTRKYHFIEEEPGIHNIFDLKETHDGDIIIAGESKAFYYNGASPPYPQQAWLLKLDQYGCLVPGCNLLDDVGETIKKPIELAIYPNPTTDYLNFQLRNNQLPQGGSFRIVDMGGHVVHSFPITTINASDTFIVPVWHWAVGAYFLQYAVDGRAVVSEKFIISH